MLKSHKDQSAVFGRRGSYDKTEKQKNLSGVVHSQYNKLEWMERTEWGERKYELIILNMQAYL